MTRLQLFLPLACALAVAPLCAAQDSLPSKPLRRLTPGAVAHGTLPRSRAELPSLFFATLSGDTLNAGSFENQRVLMLLWAADCSGRARLEAAADSLVDDAASYGARVLVVSLDSLDQVRSAGLPSRVTKAQIAIALTPKATFVNWHEMAQYEPGTPAAILVPSIVLLDADGRVRHSSFFTDRASTVNWLSTYWGR